LGSLSAGDFGLCGTGSKTVVGGFVHRGFESHPLRFIEAEVPLPARIGARA
jgi:hypothetical protein